MPEDLSQLTVSTTATIREAMTAIDRGHSGVVFVNGADGKMEGLMTDGDLRRMLLSGKSIDSPITGLFRRDFISVTASAPRAHVLDLMRALSIEQVPILDEHGRATGLHSLGKILSHSTLPNWAVIMAGGRGSRLGDLTQSTPKPMLKVAGRPIIERIVLHLVGSGIRKIHISINYLGDQIEDHLKDGSSYGCEIHYLREETPLGTGGALRLLPEMPEHPILVMNGDLVTDFNVRRLLDQHHEGGHAATMGLIPYSHRVPFGCVELKDGTVTAFKEKPLLTQLVNCGIYVVSPDLISTITPGFFPITGLFENCLRLNKSVGGCLIEDEWVDVGRPEELDLAQGKI